MTPLARAQPVNPIPLGGTISGDDWKRGLLAARERRKGANARIRKSISVHKNTMSDQPKPEYKPQPTPEELRRCAKDCTENAAKCAGLERLDGVPDDGYFAAMKRHNELSAAALTRWADEFERQSPDRPHVCGLSVDYSGKCFRCGKQVFTRDEASGS